MRILNRKGVKEAFRKEGASINKAVEDFAKLEEKRIEEDIEKAVRNARISGRKVVRREDFESV